MHLFFEPGLEPGISVLSPGESHHCVKVLRMKEGEKLFITNGKGLLCEARLIRTDPKACLIEVTKVSQDYEKRPFKLHMAVAPTKSIDRFELFLEKATELGVETITPLLCEYSERKIIKPARLEKLLVAAMKQSSRAYLPVLNPMISFSDFINNNNTGERFIAHCEMGEKRKLFDVYKKGEDVIVVIGPEGDFSEKEILLAQNGGYKAISIGKHRLRTETAAIAVCVQINAINGLL